MKKCNNPECNREFSDDMAFCPYCGTKWIPPKRKCPNPDCGFDDIPDGANFCPNCQWDLRKEMKSELFRAEKTSLKPKIEEAKKTNKEQSMSDKEKPPQEDTPKKNNNSTTLKTKDPHKGKSETFRAEKTSLKPKTEVLNDTSNRVDFSKIKRKVRNWLYVFCPIFFAVTIITLEGSNIFDGDNIKFLFVMGSVSFFIWMLNDEI